MISERKCSKPGCGALEVIGKPCTDWDCPQQFVHHTRAVPDVPVTGEGFGVGGSTALIELLHDLRFRLENIPSDDPKDDDALVSRIIRMTEKLSKPAPDVPELVRYDKSDICLAIENGFDPLPSDDGEYVHHSQAAEIIAAERSKKHRAQKVVLDLERKLAQYEAQEPMGYTSRFAIITMRHQPDAAVIAISPYVDDDHTDPIYTSPAPAADLKAENERLREALEIIEAGHGCPSALAWNALNPAGAKP